MGESADAATCWRCGTEIENWLRVLPVPRVTDTSSCVHCYVEVHGRLDDDSDSRLSVTVEVDMEALLYIATGQLPKVWDEFGNVCLPRVMWGRWNLEGGDVEVPAAELERLRRWWPQLMAYWEGID